MMHHHLQQGPSVLEAYLMEPCKDVTSRESFELFARLNQ